MQKAKHLLWLSAALVLLMSLGCMTAPKSAEQAAADTSWRFHDIVDVAFVEQYAKMPKPDNVAIIDSRPRQAKFDKGYIPTAVNIPDSQFAKMADLLPGDMATLLIFYCQGPT